MSLATSSPEMRKIPPVLLLSLLPSCDDLDAPQTATADRSATQCTDLGLPAESTVQLDVHPDGTPWSGGARRPFLVADGSALVFTSASPDITAVLASGTAAPAPNGVQQVYAMDLHTRVVHLLSVGVDGQPANADCTINEGAINEDGSVAVFTTAATNLVPNDEDGADDVFAHFTAPRFGHAAGATVRVSRGFSSDPDDPSGTAAGGRSSVASIAAVGPYVVFKSSGTELVQDPATSGAQTFRANLENLTVELASVSNHDRDANGATATPALDGDGDLVIVPAQATNLARGGRWDDERDAAWHLFSRDFATETTRQETTAASRAGLKLPPSACGLVDLQCGSFSPDLTFDGRFVVFDSNAGNLDRSSPDENAQFDVFVLDRDTGQTRLLSRNADGEAADGMSDAPEIAADGRWVVFRSRAEDLGPEGIYLVDLEDPEAAPRHVSVPPKGDAALEQFDDMPNLSANGRLLAFDADDHLYLRCLAPTQ